MPNPFDQESARLALGWMQPAQAQKHVTFNEALRRLDHLVQLTVEAFDAETPPDTPDEGGIWALGAEPAGAWAGQSGALAAWAEGGWLFLAPRPGWRAACGTDLRLWSGDAWLRPDLPELDGLPGLGVNTSHDATNRLAVRAPATLLSHDGAGHQLKVDKATAGDTASLLFQTGFAGRAELGTAGTDDFSIKVSADGAAWHTGFAMRPSDGRVTLPAGLVVQGPALRGPLRHRDRPWAGLRG